MAEAEGTGGTRASLPGGAVDVLEAFGLEGRVAVVTGASRGIGASIATALAAAGATVVGVGRAAGPLEERLDAIRRETGAEVHAVPGDAGTAVGVQAAADRVLDLCGGVDVLVNAISTNVEGDGDDVLDVDDEVWDDHFSLILMAPWRFTKAFGPGMLERQRGSIINVVSPMGLQAMTSPSTPYAATEAALWMMTRYLAVELAPHIRVNALSAGLLNDSGAARSEVEIQVAPQVALRRVGHSDEAAGAALFLASDASRYTTASFVSCDGGLIPGPPDRLHKWW